ncbi:MAG: dihydrofolate reductase [Candidatus Limivicinus sp.]|nr:dihydrofolate reductase [Candidatus Limivicinus sp.]
MEAIVAVYSDWGIGSGGTQPVVLKSDRAHFKELTDGAAVIVGRKTLGDFPGGRPLKGRHNIVVTRQDIEVAGAQVAHSTGEALTLAAEYERCLVIGGASVYRQFMPYLDTVYVTKIDLAPQSDSYFENLDSSPNWERIDEERWQSEGDIRYCFVTYKRRA